MQKFFVNKYKQNIRKIEEGYQNHYEDGVFYVNEDMINNSYFYSILKRFSLIDGGIEANLDIVSCLFIDDKININNFMNAMLTYSMLKMDDDEYKKRCNILYLDMLNTFLTNKIKDIDTAQANTLIIIVSILASIDTYKDVEIEDVKKIIKKCEDMCENNVTVLMQFVCYSMEDYLSKKERRK